MQIPFVPTKWQQLTKKWLISVAAAALAIIYLYQTQPPLVFKVAAGFLRVTHVSQPAQFGFHQVKIKIRKSARHHKR